MNYWLVKTEPESYSLDDLKREGVAEWDGVRNPLAQQHLREMENGDLVLIYHTGKEKAVVGLAEVVREGYLDPTDEKGRSVCVDLKYLKTYKKPLSLAEVKQESALSDMPLVRISRLSVMPVKKSHWNRIQKMLGETE